MQRLGQLETELRENYYRSLVGSREQLLVESAETACDGGTLLRGTTARYAPAELLRYGAVPEAGSLVDVEVQSADGNRLVVT